MWPVKLSLLIVVFLVSSIVSASDEENVRHILASDGDNCSELESVYSSMSNVEIRKLSRRYSLSQHFEVSGYMHGEYITLGLWHTRACSSGRGWSGCSDRYGCSLYL